MDARNTNRADATGNTVSVVNVVSPLAVLHVALFCVILRLSLYVVLGRISLWFLNPHAKQP